LPRKRISQEVFGRNLYWPSVGHSRRRRS
jgi:hypothetical protein